MRYEARASSTVGPAIREFRAAAQMTQADLARRAGVHRSYLSALENGKTTEALEQLFFILHALGVRVVLEKSE